MPDDLLPAPPITPAPAEPPLAEVVPIAADETMREGVALGVDPATEGKLIQASMRTGIQREQLRLHKEYQVNDLMQQDTRMRAYQKSIDLAAWVAANPGYADVSRDDELALLRVRAATDEWLDQVRNAPTTAEKWMRPVLEIGGGLATGVIGTGRAAYGTAAFLSELVSGEDSTVSKVLRDLASESDANTVKAHLRGIPVSEVQKQNQRLRDSTTSVFGLTPGDVAGGFTSLAPTLVAGAASGGALWAILGAAGLQSAGGMYADLRDKDETFWSASGKAALSGAITAGLTAVFPTAEKGLAALMRAAPNAKTAARMAFSKVIGQRIAGEATEEAIDEFAQSIIRGDSLGEAVDAAIKAGLIGGVIGGSVGVGEARTAHRVARAEGAASFHKSVDSLVKELDSSKTMERSSEVMKSFLQASRPELKTAPAVFAGTDLQAAMADPLVAEHLTQAGITKEAVDAAAESGGVIRTTQEKVLLDLPAETREKIRPFMRESADAMSQPEATEVLDAVKAEKQQSEIATEAKRTIKLVKKERARLIAELQKSSRGGINKEQATQVIELASRKAMSAAMRDSAAGASELAFLRKLTIKDTANLEAAEVRQRLTNRGGKDALARISLSNTLGTVAGRVDLLTGQVTINPGALVDERQVDAMMREARGKALDLKGKQVTVKTPDGSARVDAEGAVGTMRDRVERVRRLQECMQ